MQLVAVSFNIAQHRWTSLQSRVFSLNIDEHRCTIVCFQWCLWKSMTIVVQSFKSIRNRWKSLYSRVFSLNIDERRCTVMIFHWNICENRQSFSPPVRSSVRPPCRPPALVRSSVHLSGRPSVRPSTRTGTGRTWIHKTPDRPPWEAVTRMISNCLISIIPDHIQLLQTF